MDVRGAAASLSVQEAMKILNMRKFTAEELNSKFQYRVQSITRGLGGSLETQKTVYTAWEYLNRMLARETSNQTEEVLKKVDKTVKLLEKPKQLDVIPVRMDNRSKKASLIIQKETTAGRKPRNLGRVNPIKFKMEDENRQDPEKSLGVSELPGQLFQKHIKWMDQLKSTGRSESVEKRAAQGRSWEKKGGSARIANTAQKRPTKDPTMRQLKEIVRIDRAVKSEAEERGVAAKREEMGKILEKLPKLPRTQSQALLFKRTTAFNEMFENPKKPSKFDLRSSSKKAVWKERAEQILKEPTGSAQRKKSGTKTKSRKASRRLVSKQPVEQVLYRTADPEDGKACQEASNSLPPSNRKRTDKQLSRQLHKGADPEDGKIRQVPSNNLPLSNCKQEDNTSLLTHGPFTPSRIMKWIKSTQS